MFRLVVTPEIKDEIQALRRVDIDAAAVALVLLEQLDDDQRMLEVLCLRDNHYLYQPPFEAYPFVMAQRQGYNIYILKFRDDEDGSLPPYRILVGFDAQRDTYYALALTHRSESYAGGSDAYRQLLARYEQHGIPIYR